MAKTSFKAAVEEAPTKEVAQDAPAVGTQDKPKAETAIAVREEQPVSTDVKTSGDFLGYDSGGLDGARPPRIHLANKSGDLGNTFAPGTFVFDKAVGLNKKPDEPIDITIIRSEKYFQEILEFGGEALPKRAPTPEAVAELGGTLKWEEKDAKQLWGPVADLTVVIKRPEGDLPEEQDMHFYLEIEGHKFAAAKWFIAKSAYRSVYPQLKTAASMWASKAGLCSAKWKLTSYLDKRGTNSYYVPAIRGAGLHPDELVAKLRELRGGE